MHPVLFHAGRVVVPTFALLLVAGLLVAALLAERLAPAAGVPASAAWDGGVLFVAMAFLASRLLLVAEDVRSFLAAPVLLLMQPSLTAGGLFLASLGTVAALRWRGLGVLRMGDAWAGPAMVAWAGFALGELAAGLDPGMPARRWGLRTSLAGYREVPVALWAAGAALVLALWLSWRVRQPHGPGQVAGLGLLSGGVAQFCLGFGRLPYLYAPGSPWTLLDPVQWDALGAVVAGVVVLAAVRSTKAVGALTAEKVREN